MHTPKGDYASLALHIDSAVQASATSPALLARPMSMKTGFGEGVYEEIDLELISPNAQGSDSAEPTERIDEQYQSLPWELAGAGIRYKRPECVLGLSMLHDAGLTLFSGGKPVIVLEAERLFSQRYFSWSRYTFLQQIHESTALVKRVAKLDTEQIFDLGAIARCSWHDSEYFSNEFKMLSCNLPKCQLTAADWILVDHHAAHALSAAYFSDHSTPALISYDGGGNDGSFVLYQLRRPMLVLLDGDSAQSGGVLRPGAYYTLMASLIGEIWGNDSKCSTDNPQYDRLDLAGKVMAYSALGMVHSEWVSTLLEIYRGKHRSLLGSMSHCMNRARYLNQSDCKCDFGFASLFTQTQRALTEHEGLDLAASIPGQPQVTPRRNTGWG